MALNGAWFLDFIPSLEAGVPLQVPSEVHLRILDPLRIKPSSQSKDTSWGYTVRLPYIDPFDGALIGPQSLAKTGWKIISRYTKQTIKKLQKTRLGD